MLQKVNEKKYTNTLVLDMFDLVKFIKFDTEYSECCWNEDVIIYKDKEWNKSSLLDMVWVIPLKWYMSDLDYEYIKLFFNNEKVDLKKYKNYLKQENIEKYKDSIVFIKDELFYLRWKWKRKETIEIESLDKIFYDIETPFIPLKWIIDNKDYEKLEYWFNINSTIPERILKRWDLLYEKKEKKEKCIFTYTKTTELDQEDLDSIIWDILGEWFYNEDIYKKEIEIVINISKLDKKINEKKIQKEIENLKNEKKIENLNLKIQYLKN